MHTLYCRQDSTIVTPYESWQYYDPAVVTRPQTIDYAAGKTKKVAWFVSNCGARNGRLQYAQELAKYIRDGNPIYSLKSNHLSHNIFKFSRNLLKLLKY